MMKFTSLVLSLFVYSSSLHTVIGQITNATCILASLQWSFNSENQSPCVVASSLLGVCTGSSYDVQALPDQNQYHGPSIDTVNDCQCSTVTYSLMSACGLCQNRTIISWSEWSGNCPRVSISTYNPTLPPKTPVPGWAYLDVKATDIFNADTAKQSANATESSATPMSSTASSLPTKATATSTPPDPSAEAAKAAKRRDTIANAVIGTLCGILVVGGLLGFIFFRNREKQRNLLKEQLEVPVTPTSAGSPTSEKHNTSYP